MSDVFSYPGAPEALENRRAVLDAFPDDKRRLIRGVTAPDAVAVGLRIGHAFRNDRQVFEDAFTAEGLDIDGLSNIDTRALAFWQADVLYRQATDPARTLDDVIAMAKPLRRVLLDAAKYLFDDDDTLRQQVREIRRGRGYRDMADDLVQLDALFTEHWSDVEGQSRVTLADLEQARELGVQLLAVLGTSNADKNERVAAARDLRERAGSDFLNALDKIRAAAKFVFQDAPDRLLEYPSVWSGNRRRRVDVPEDEVLDGVVGTGAMAAES